MPIEKHLLWFGIVLLIAASAAHGQQVYPNRPIRLIVPFAPGGGNDIIARAVAQKLSERWSQTVVPDNRAGANGTIGVDLTAKAAPDGYTITIISSSHAVNSGLYAKLPYDLSRDLAPITQTTSQPYVMVIHPSVPAKTVKEFIAYWKANPGGLNYGSSGTGSIAHLGGALFGSMTGVEMVHIPYKGGAPATLDLIAGRCQMQLGSLLLTGPHVKTGKLRTLAVTTPKRWPSNPELPTIQEAGVPTYSITQWHGLLAPKDTPPAIINKLNKEISHLLHLPEVTERLAADGAEIVASAPAEFGLHIKSEIEKYGKVIRMIGLKAE